MAVIDSRVVNLDELNLEHFAKGAQFETRGARIGPLLGAKNLGYSYDVVPDARAAVAPLRSMSSASRMTGFT